MVSHSNLSRESLPQRSHLADSLQLSPLQHPPWPHCPQAAPSPSLSTVEVRELGPFWLTKPRSNRQALQPYEPLFRAALPSTDPPVQPSCFPFCFPKGQACAVDRAPLPLPLPGHLTFLGHPHSAPAPLYLLQLWCPFHKGPCHDKCCTTYRKGILSEKGIETCCPPLPLH